MSGLRANALRAIRAQPMAALGLLILLAWSVAALGAIGGGAGWMRIARYDPTAVFKIANPAFAEARAADALDGQPSNLSDDELTALLTQPEIYDEIAAELGATDDLLNHIQNLINDGALIERLTESRQSLLEIDDGRFTLAPRPITAVNPRPQITGSLQRPSWRHWFGTNRAGNDVYARIVDAAWSPLMIGFLAALFGVAAGLAIGRLQRVAPRPEWSDIPINGLLGGLYAFPPLVLLLIFLAYVEYGQIWFALLLAPFALLPAARIAREADSIRAAAAPLLGLFGAMMAAAILLNAAAAFLGVGAAENTWGAMIADGRQYIIEAPWTSLFPGLALISAAFAAHTLGRGLQRLAEHQPVASTGMQDKP